MADDASALHSSLQRLRQNIPDVPSLGFTEGKRFSRFYFNNVIGNPLDTTIALSHQPIVDAIASGD